MPHTRLHIVIHGFVLEEDTKPVDERNLQAFPTLLQASFLPNMIVTVTYNLLTPNTDGWGKKLVTVFAVRHLDRFRIT